MAAMGPENSAGIGPGGSVAYRVEQQDGVSATAHSSRELIAQQTPVRGWGDQQSQVLILNTFNYSKTKIILLMIHSQLECSFYSDV